MKEKWKQRIRKKQFQQDLAETGGMPQSAAFHREAYHRHFQGYTEIKRSLTGKGSKIQRIYTGKYYEPVLNLLQQKQLRFVYLVFSVIGAGLYLFCTLQPTICNTVSYVVIFQATSVILLLWTAYLLCFYIPSTGKMTEGDYKALHFPLILASLLTSISMWLTGLAGILCFFLNRDRCAFPDFLCSIGFCAGGCFLFVLFFMEKRLIYRTVNNKTEGPDEGVEIEE